ncbi:transcription termination/antitermination NusG family protein [Roseburia hominis]
MGAKVTGKNWYILFVQIEKQSQICTMLQNEGVHAFLPMMEYYRRDSKGIAVKLMFPGYVFVRSELEQKEFDDFLKFRKGCLWGVIKQLKEDGNLFKEASYLRSYRGRKEEHKNHVYQKRRFETIQV